jgi:hypothetical protein
MTDMQITERTFMAAPDTAEIIDRKATIAAQLGLDADRIHGVKLQLDELRKNGILVDLDVRGLSLFSRSASWLELGIEEDDVRQKRFTRGQKFLIPEDQVRQLRSIESSMRQHLDECSFGVTGVAPYKWIPVTAYPEFRAGWEELVGRFEEAKADILDHYDEYVDLLAADFTEVAAQAWDTFQARAGERALVLVTPDGKRFTDCDGFTDYIVTLAIARMPTRERIEKDLQADYTTQLVYGEQDTVADELSAQRLRIQAQEERRQAEHEDFLVRAEEEERLVAINAMRQAEAEHARQRLAQMADPFEEVFAELRRRIAADAQQMLESVRKNKFLRGKVAEKGRGLLDLYDMLASHSDYELRDKLVSLRRAIGPVGQDRSEDAPDRDAEEIADILRQVVDLSHNAQQELLSSGASRFSMLD